MEEGGEGDVGEVDSFYYAKKIHFACTKNTCSSLSRCVSSFGGVIIVHAPYRLLLDLTSLLAVTAKQLC